MADDRRRLGNDLTISVERPSEGLVVIGLTGELDISNRAAVEDAVTAARADGAPMLVLDLTELRFMDSSGLRLLIDAWNESQLAESGLRVVVPKTGLVRRVLEVSGTDTILPIVDHFDDLS
jgi:anti-anti-sigma factor